MLFYILILVPLAIQKDYLRKCQQEELVKVTMWTCGKSLLAKLIKSHEWNKTLYSLPYLETHPYKGNKPIEAFFDWSDTIKVNYSEEARAFGLFENRTNDTICLFVTPLLSICNVFDYCWWWPLVVPLKAIFYILKINIHE